MPDNPDDALLSAIERFKKGEETQDDRKIIGQAFASKQIEIPSAEDSKVIQQTGGANFGESNEIRVSGPVIGTQSISGFSAEQVIELLKLYDSSSNEIATEEIEKSKRKTSIKRIYIVTALAVTIIAVVLLGVYLLRNILNNDSTKVVASITDTATSPITTGIPPSSTNTPTPTDTPTPTATITPTPTATITPTPTATITPTDTNSPTSNNCQNQRNILIYAFITERVNEAIKPQKQVTPPASTLTPNPPPEQWTDSTRKAVVAHFDEYKQSFPISEIIGVVIDRQSIESSKSVGETCIIFFDAKFYINTQYKCGDYWVDSENLEIKSIGSKAVVEDTYYSPGNSTRQITWVQLFIDNDIKTLCTK